jgi:hypothetical protein
MAQELRETLHQVHRICPQAARRCGIRQDCIGCVHAHFADGEQRFHAMGAGISRDREQRL